MTALLRSYLLLLVGLLATITASGQIRVSRIDVNRWVRENFTGQGVLTGNIKVHGNELALSAFNSSNKVLEIPKGLVLTTGLASTVAGLNSKYNETYPFGDAEKDRDLQKLVKPSLYDVCLVEFDFVPLANSLQFTYQFGSEEYPEYVGSTYNDVFGFFVSDESTTSNIAVIPGTNLPVSVNTINHRTNTNLFIDNNVFSKESDINDAAAGSGRRGGFFSSLWAGLKSVFSKQPRDEVDENGIGVNPALVKKVNPATYRSLQYDGITKKLTAQTYVVPFKKYHLKIIIADVSDNIYDSGVFIEDKSLTAKRDTSQPGYIDYPDLSKVVDPKQLLDGKRLEDLLADTVHLDTKIYFDFDKADLLPSEKSKLRGIAATYDRIKEKYIMRVAGHTDSIGNLSYNMALSRRRNHAVIDYLQQIRNIEIPVEITEDAYLNPAANNSTDEGRTKNRRVEIFFVKRD